MKYKISNMERKVGLFVLISFAALFAVMVTLVAKSHFFNKTVTYLIEVETVNQLQKGTKIQVRGLTIGAVSDINVNESGVFSVQFDVDQKYHGFFKTGSSVHFKNPLIVGEKVLEVVIGPGPELMEEGSILPVNEGEDLIKKIGDINWQKINSIIEKFDSTMGHTNILMAALSKDLPKATSKAPKIAADAEKAVAELNVLIKGLTELQPDLKKTVGGLPGISDKTDKAIAEAIIVLKAAQKTWLLKSNVKEVKKEQGN